MPDINLLERQFGEERQRTKVIPMPRRRGIAPIAHLQPFGYLPRYSPDLNPIEQAFSRFEGGHANTPSELRRASGSASGCSSSRSLPPNARTSFDMPHMRKGEPSGDRVI
jgi:hypothetical protein